MIIKNVNSGRKADFELVGDVLIFENQLELDLSALQREYPTLLDVCLDSDYQTLVINSGIWYVANILIPAKEYVIINDSIKWLPLDSSKVEVQLWALPSEYVKTEQGEN